MDDVAETVDTEEGKTGEDLKTKPREIVVPGDLLDEGTLKAGIGTYQIGNKIFSAQVGLKSVRSNYINVISLAGRYMPKIGDTVIGMIADISPTSWIIDINSPYPAPLHINEVPWRIEFGETSRYLNIGDIVLAKVMSVDEIKRVQVSMRGQGLRKLNGGQILEISPSKVPRVIGKSGSMITLLKKYTKCHLFVGQNGRIWLDGGIDDIVMASKAIKMIERAAHISGLTSKMENFLRETTGIGN
jgi:exosome complex component RRP4